MDEAQRPKLVSIDAQSGVGIGFDEHYAKHLRDLVDIYEDASSLAAVSADLMAYEVHSSARTGNPGELIVGTSVLMPALVGDEFAMTRGHIHEIVDRAEMYYCLAGRGVMLMEDWHGTSSTVEIRPGDITYVPGGWIHRSINVGSEPLVTLFCFSSDAGQNYAVIDDAHGMSKRVVSDGIGGWLLRDNPAYVPRSTDPPARLGPPVVPGRGLPHAAKPPRHETALD